MDESLGRKFEPQDFSKGPWRLRNGRVVANLKIVTRALSPPDAWPEVSFQQAWYEPATGLYWDLEGIHITTEEWGYGSSMADIMLDIVQKYTPSAPQVATATVRRTIDTRRKVYVVTGGSSGLGGALCRQLLVAEDKLEVFNLDCSCSHFGASSTGLHDIFIDLQHEDSIKRVRDFLPRKIDVLVNCAGINHIEWFDKLKLADWDMVMDVNARAIYQLSQALLPNLEDGTICNIISNASHVPMTNSLVYNASKAAAHMMTLQMARELSKTHGITVFGISPNKMAGTKMSQYIEGRVPELRGWTPEQAAEYQKQSLICGEETDVETVAEFLTFLLTKKQRHKYLSGCIIPYGA